MHLVFFNHIKHKIWPVTSYKILQPWLILLLRYKMLQLIPLIWNTVVNWAIICHVLLVQFTLPTKFLLKSKCLHHDVRQITVLLHTCSRETACVVKSFLKKTVIIFWHKMLCHQEKQRGRKTVIQVVNGWHHKSLNKQPFQTDIINFKNYIPQFTNVLWRPVLDHWDLLFKLSNNSELILNFSLSVPVQFYSILKWSVLN